MTSTPPARSAWSTAHRRVPAVGVPLELLTVLLTVNVVKSARSSSGTNRGTRRFRVLSRPAGQNTEASPEPARLRFRSNGLLSLTSSLTRWEVLRCTWVMEIFGSGIRPAIRTVGSGSRGPPQTVRRSAVTSPPARAEKARTGVLDSDLPTTMARKSRRFGYGSREKPHDTDSRIKTSLLIPRFSTLHRFGSLSPEPRPRTGRIPGRIAHSRLRGNARFYRRDALLGSKGLAVNAGSAASQGRRHVGQRSFGHDE